MSSSGGARNLVLHIGLHKTGTKYLQHRVFPDLAREGYIDFNPPVLTQLCCDLMRAEGDDVPAIQEAIKREKQNLSAERVTVVSREIMAGDLFSGYKNAEDTIDRLGEAFPEAQVLCVLRFQLGWLESVYKESIHEHHYQSFSEFITPGSHSGYAQVNPLDISWVNYARLLQLAFSTPPHFLFYEDFVHNPRNFFDATANVIRVPSERLMDLQPHDDRPNRGYSALAIQLSLLRRKIADLLGFPKVHRPIFFLGPAAIPAGREDLSVLPKEKYWGASFARDNEEIRSPQYPALRGKERLRFLLSWRSMMRRLDGLVYVGWSPSPSLQASLSEAFWQQNEALPEALGLSRHVIPPQYFGGYDERKILS